MSTFDLGSIVFYVDEDLDSDQFVVPVREAGFQVVRHRDILPKGTLDPEWIPFVASRNWFALTHDRRISHVESERDLVMDHELGLFVVRGQTRFEGHPLLASKVVGAKTSIGNFVYKNYRPFIASIVGPHGKKRRYRCEGRKPPSREWNEGKMKARRQLRDVAAPPLE